jgi:hypothetical protein
MRRTGWMLAATLLLCALAPVAVGASAAGLVSRGGVSVLQDAPAHAAGVRLPVGALASVSSALGADDPVYRPGLHAGSITAMNPRQQLALHFDTSGVQVRAGGATLSMRLTAYGYRGSMRAAGTVVPRVSVNRVSYHYGALSEWYANGPLGLEQGFTLSARPAGAHTGPLTLALALSGNVRPALSHGAVNFSGVAGVALTYRDLVVSDAAGRALPSRIESSRGRLWILVDDRGASYPLRIDPMIQQGSKLTASASQGSFGLSVALSADGNTALIGDPGDSQYVGGAAWVFTRSGSNWTRQGPALTASDETGAGAFGSSVALSSDGNTALIGGPGDSSGVGAAWLFTRSGSTWTQQGLKLTASDEIGTGAFGAFGAGVTLSADGNTALIGGESDNSYVGAAWAFTRSGSIWTQQGLKLTASDEIGVGYFGSSVALSADGSTALIGSGAGGAWVFTRSGSTWTQQGLKLAASGQIGTGAFGSSVALSADGNTALIGDPGDNHFVGAAWVFTRSGSAWTQQGLKLTASDEIGTGVFGSSVALSADGNTALIGGPGDGQTDGGFCEPDAAWVFTRSGATWTQQGTRITPSDESPICGPFSAGPEASFGASVSLSADGNTALIGGWYDGGSPGAAWIFQNPSPPSATITSPASHRTYNLDQVVGTHFACVEGSGGSGISSCVDSNGSGSPGVLDTRTAGPHTYVVTATSKDGQSGRATIGYTVVGPPSASISSPADGRTYRLNQVVPTAFLCVEAAGGPGIVSCVDSNGFSSPGQLQTSRAGSHTYITRAISADGQVGTATVDYTVARAAQRISFTSTPPSRPAIGGRYALTATGGGSGNAVTFSIDSSSARGACSIHGDRVSFTGAGRCVLDANQAGNSNYLAAPQVQQSLRVIVAARSVVALTLHYVQGSAKYDALSTQQRAALNARAREVSAILMRLTAHLSKPQKAKLITSYKTGVAALKASGWLTATQAANLTAAATRL